MSDAREKRQHRRAKASIVARCTLIDHPVGPDGEMPMIVSRLTDISAAGLRLDFPGVMSVGMRIRVEFETEMGRSVTLHGEVVRCDSTVDVTSQLVVHGLCIIDQPEVVG
ncbi:MAG TPA: PilZ domain-containing protein [Capsulimonadaceae bacterium]|jgi:hypothetical protein